MKTRRELRTDRRLWAVFGTVAFVLLGFVHLFNDAVEQKVGPSHLWGVWQTTLDRWSHADAPAGAVAYTLLVAAAAALLGWVAQAVVVVARDAATRTPPASE